MVEEQTLLSSFPAPPSLRRRVRLSYRVNLTLPIDGRVRGSPNLNRLFFTILLSSLFLLPCFLHLSFLFSCINILKVYEAQYKFLTRNTHNKKRQREKVGIGFLGLLNCMGRKQRMPSLLPLQVICIFFFVLKVASTHTL